MPDTIDQSVLEENLHSQIERLERNRNRDKAKAKKATIVSAAGSATATLLLGISKFIEPLEAFLQAGSLILGTITTIVIAWDRLFDHKRLWVISAQTVRELYVLREEIEHVKSSGQMSQDQSRTYYQKYRDIISEGDKKWDMLRNKN